MIEQTDQYESMTVFSLDPGIDNLESRYFPYLESHGINSNFHTFKVEWVNTDETVLTYKFSWNTEIELPIDLKRDILSLYHQHFEV